jgi:hypothetical protein
MEISQKTPLTMVRVQTSAWRVINLCQSGSCQTTQRQVRRTEEHEPHGARVGARSLEDNRLAVSIALPSRSELRRTNGVAFPGNDPREDCLKPPMRRSYGVLPMRRHTGKANSPAVSHVLSDLDLSDAFGDTQLRSRGAIKHEACMGTRADPRSRCAFGRASARSLSRLAVAAAHREPILPRQQEQLLVVPDGSLPL